MACLENLCLVFAETPGSSVVHLCKSDVRGQTTSTRDERPPCAATREMNLGFTPAYWYEAVVIFK